MRERARADECLPIVSSTSVKSLDAYRGDGRAFLLDFGKSAAIESSSGFLFCFRSQISALVEQKARRRAKSLSDRHLLATSRLNGHNAEPPPHPHTTISLESRRSPLSARRSLALTRSAAKWASWAFLSLSRSSRRSPFGWRAYTRNIRAHFRASNVQPLAR